MRHSLLMLGLAFVGCADNSTADGQRDQISPPPTIDSISPAEGPTTGGQPIVIDGGGFQAGATVTIAGFAADPVAVLSSKQIMAHVPLHLDMRGRQPVQVTVAGKTAQSDSLFSYYPGVIHFAAGADQPSGAAPLGMSAQDLNGDGLSDLIVGYQVDGLKRPGPTVSVLLAQEGGTFQLAGEYSAPDGMYGLVVADVNGDGQEDVVTANSTDDTVSVWLNLGTAQLGPPTQYLVGTHPVAVVVADFDRQGGSNGRMDLLTANQDDGGATLLIAQQEGYTSYIRSDLQLPETAWALAAGDMNGDGDTDLVYTAYDNRVIRVMLGQGDETFTSVDPPLATGASPVALALADLNGDGHLDAVVVNNESATVSVYLGSAGGQLRFSGSAYVGVQPRSVAVADVNQDGIPDLVVPCSGSQAVSLLLGVGDGTFLEAQLYGAGGDLSAGVVGTLQAGGLLDFLVLGNSALRVLQNQSQ